MLLEKIPLGKTLEIFVEREGYRYRLVSKVEDTNEIRVCVTAIASRGRFFEFRPTDKVRLVYQDEEFMWEWDNVKAGLAKLEGTPIHYFQIMDKGRTFNRRNAYRVKVTEDILVQYYKIPGYREKSYEAPTPPENMTILEELDWQEKYENPVQAEGLLRDFSENGVGIFTDAVLEKDDGIFFDIPSSYGDLTIKAVVIRKTQMRSLDVSYNNYYGCAIAESDNRLRRYIYEVQRERLKVERWIEKQRQMQRDGGEISEE